MDRFQWEKADLTTTRKLALASTLTKVSRILTGRKTVTVKLKDEDSRYPAWNDGQNVTINLKKFQDFHRRSTLMAIISANHHETAHLLYTPNSYSGLGAFVRQNPSFKRSWNILEDQRIETLFTARYRPARRYFTSLIVKFLVNNEDEWGLGHMLTHGRRFLPREIRDGFRDKFIGTSEQRREGEEIIDKYRLLSMLDDDSHRTAIQLVQKFHYLLEDISLGSGQDVPGDHHIKDREESNPDPGKMRSDSEAARKETEEQDEAEEDPDVDGSGFWDEEEDEADDDDGEREESSGNGSDSEADSSDEGDGGDLDGDDDESGGSMASDSPDDSEGEGDDELTEPGEGGNAAGTGGYDDDNGEIDLEQALHDVLDAVKNSDDVQNDIDNVVGSMDNPELNLDEMDRAKFIEEDVDPAVAAAATATAREFERLQGDVQPGWRYGSDHGRLNVSRAMQFPDEPDEWFDEWEEGREQDTGMELVIMIDTSGSMDGAKIRQAADSLWIIKRAVDEFDCVTSVIGFDSYTAAFYDRDEKAHPSKVRRVRAKGGTAPKPALGAARRIFNQSDKPVKMLVVITDGAWSGSVGDLLDQIDAFRMIIGIGVYSTDYLPQASDGCHTDRFNIARAVSSADEIAPLVAEAVENLVRRNIGM